MWYICLLFVLAAARADALYKRATVQLEGTGFATFQNQFRTAMAMKVAQEINQTQPLLQQLETDMHACARTINDTRDICLQCAGAECEGGVEDIFMAGINGIGQGFEDLGKGIADWEGWNDMGDFFKGVGNVIAGWSGWGDMTNWFSGAGNTIAGWSGWNDMGNWFKGAGNTIKTGWNDFGNGVNDFGNAIGDIGKGIGGLFGRDLDRRWPWGRHINNRHKRDITNVRRAYISLQLRTIPDETRACMEKCPSCEPFLVDQSSMISMVCGESLVNRNITLAARMHMLKAVYEAVTDNVDIIVTSIAYDPTKFSPLTMAYTDVYVRARVHGVYETYKSVVPYTVMDVAAAAENMAMELYDRWG